jgi:hypothetical protein
MLEKVSECENAELFFQQVAALRPHPFQVFDW